MTKHYQVEAFDAKGSDLLPPRTILIIEDQAKAEEEAKKLTSFPISYLVTTELTNVCPEE